MVHPLHPLGACVVAWLIVSAVSISAGEVSSALPSTSQSQSPSNPLTLTLALERALATDDPSLGRHTARAISDELKSVAVMALPDPELTAQVSNVPIDDFSLRDEPMTQALRFGIRQRFPAGRTLALRGEQGRLAAEAARARTGLAERDLALAVREDWYRLLGALRAVETLARAAEALEAQKAALSSAFSTGRMHAQDLYRVELEHALIVDRQTEQRRMADEARARLKRYLGPAAFGPIATDLPPLPPLPPPGALDEHLLTHPAVAAQRALVAVAGAAVELAGEARKPDVALEAGYGLRVDRADMASVGITVSLPMLRGAARDHAERAAISEKSAVELDRDLLLLEYRQRLDGLLVREQRLIERQQLYRELVATRAQATAEATVGTYAASETDFSELVRARLAALEVALRQIALDSEIGQTRAQLLWLLGEPS